MDMLVLAALMLAPQTGAASGGTPQTIATLIKCRAISDDTERLRCMDAAVARMDEARSSGDLIVLDREKVVERRRAQFGLSSTGDAATGTAPIREVITTIRAVAPSPTYGRTQLELANGQVWETTGTMRFQPKPGSNVTLRAASLGGFRADMGREVVAVKRVR